MRIAFRPLALIAGLAAGATACTGRPGSVAGAAPSPLQAAALRASQAPIVGLTEALGVDTLLGKRVRVLGWCEAAPGLLVGRRSGAWILATPDTAIEVRGLVPRDCRPEEVRQTLVLVFAQVVRSSPGSEKRLLLRLPD